MLNSSPGKGIIDTGCAKMMMGSDTFKQYLHLLTSKERASVEEVREKNRFRFGDNETRMSRWSAVIPMNIGKHVCREKVAIILGDAPFSISKPFLQRMSSSGGCERSCRRWTIGNFADDSGVFVIKDECCKYQQALLPGPWTGRTVIEERCDEFEGHV